MNCPIIKLKITVLCTTIKKAYLIKRMTSFLQGSRVATLADKKKDFCTYLVKLRTVNTISEAFYMEKYSKSLRHEYRNLKKMNHFAAVSYDDFTLSLLS